jgi:hypothetical protein
MAVPWSRFSMVSQGSYSTPYCTHPCREIQIRPIRTPDEHVVFFLSGSWVWGVYGFHLHIVCVGVSIGIRVLVRRCRVFLIRVYPVHHMSSYHQQYRAVSPDEQEGVLPTRKKGLEREEGDRAYIVYESTIYSPLDSPLRTLV